MIIHNVSTHHLGEWIKPILLLTEFWSRDIFTNDYRKHTLRFRVRLQFPFDMSRREQQEVVPCVSPGYFLPFQSAFCIPRFIEAAVPQRLQSEAGGQKVVITLLSVPSFSLQCADEEVAQGSNRAGAETAHLTLVQAYVPCEASVEPQRMRLDRTCSYNRSKVSDTMSTRYFTSQPISPRVYTRTLQFRRTRV